MHMEQMDNNYAYIFALMYQFHINILIIQAQDNQDLDLFYIGKMHCKDMMV